MIAIHVDGSPPLLHLEAGVHRIQRVPPNERRGRVHSSSITVAIIQKTKTAVASVKSDDLSYRWHAGTGPGGQNRNKVKCCLELTHLPTGITANANGRSRRDNEELARSSIEQQLARKLRDDRNLSINKDRKSQIGHGGRSDDRIRTWRFQEGVVIDHRSGKKIKLSKILRGQLQLLK